MLSIESAQKLISHEFDNITFPGEPGDLYDPVKYILSAGGKRMRPVLVLLTCDLFGKDPREAVYPAMGIEIFHNFTLLHDDLMDNSPVRRNNPTVHIKWNSNTAILSGDAMSIIASKYISKADPSVLPVVLELFNDTALKVCEGQMMDMEFEKQDYVSMSRYMEMISLKTSVLIAASTKMGALVASASQRDSSLLYDFGLNIGLAFQIQDDMLDLYGNEETFGKKIGNDIVTNKKTFLLIKALELASGNKLMDLKTLLSSQDLPEIEKIDSVRGIFNQLNIQALAGKQIDHYFERASACLDAVDIVPERKKVLQDYALSLLERRK